jgi:hypothetical protein
MIDLFDKKILKMLSEDEMDESKIQTLSDVKMDYIKELNNQIRIKNTREMFK